MGIEQFTIRTTIDKAYDMGYAYLQHSEDVRKSIAVYDKKNQIVFVLDVDSNGRLLGIEFFNASKSMPTKWIEAAEDITGYQ